MNKQYILEKIEELQAIQLAKFITDGTVTMEELKNTELLDRTKRVAISKELEKGDQERKRTQEERDRVDDSAWDTVRYGNEITLTDWITNNSDNKHIQEAKNRINFLQEERERIKNQKQGVLDNIRSNPGFYSPNDIKEYLGNNTFTEQDLLNCDIPQSAIDNLDKIKAPNLKLGKTPTAIPEGYTEVYFWGGTGSGKTTALGAILHMAQQKGYLNIANGPGFLYANQLKNIFSDDGCANDFLPAPSPLETTQYLPFTLKKEKERKSRSVSLIELSGEIFKCFFHKNAGNGFPTQSHENTFNSLNNFLKSNNRKIHFFFIDYARENRTDKDGLTQSDYLAAASNYFSKNDVFGKTTDAIYIVLTKSDLLLDKNGKSVPQDQRGAQAKQYLMQNNYKSFINTLKGICKKNSINGGRLTVEPFSLGKVYFKEICDFNGTAASKILEIFMECIKSNKKSFLDVFNQ